MPDLRVFVSFTKRGGDGDFVRRLIARLTAQPITVWVFEEESEEIHGGESIVGRLRRQIEDSNVFVPVVSLNSFESDYTRLEVEHALRQAAGRSQVIVPFVSRQVVQDWRGNWPGAYQELAGLRYRVVDFDSRSSLEAAVIGFCCDIHVEFCPLLPEDPRLPFMDRFVAEVRKKCPQREEYEIGIYRRLMLVFGQFAEAFQKHDYDAARWLMQYFCTTCEYEFREQEFYYPYVVKGVCEILAGKLEDAEHTFESLSANPLLDETFFGALGYIKQQQRDHAKALEFYREAGQRRPDDSAAKTGVVLNTILCGLPVDVDTVFRDIEQGRFLADEDRVKVKAVKAFALASAGRAQQAIRLFEELVAADQADTATVVHFTKLLKDHHELHYAVRILESFKDRHSDPILLHYLASYTACMGDFHRAAIHFTELVDRHPNVRQYRIDAAQVLCRIGDRSKARALCAPLLDSKSFLMPQTPSDFFLDGFANWILGRTERADYDFHRSGFPSEKHYRNLLPIDPHPPS